MVKRLVQNLLHKELSYALHGSAIEVRKDFGPGHKEKLYHKAFEEELKRREISFERELAIKIYSPKDGKYIGLYRPDFIIDKKIIVEIKAEKFVSRDEIKRIYDYLRNSGYELAYLINFASPRLFVRRIIYTNDRKPLNRPPTRTNTKLINTKGLLVSIGLILVLFSGVSIQAAELKLDSQTQELGVNQIFQADLLLDTENEEINAVEGKIVLQEDLLELKEIREGNSIINFWIERPSIPLIDTNINTNKHEIVFSGIIPGGYSSDRGLLFSVIFETKKEGAGTVEIREAKALLNDGQGTATKLKIKNLELVVISVDISGISWASQRDAESPEDFKPEIAQDPNIFEGKWFLVFATQDKGSGVDHYEIYEDLGFRIQDLVKMIKKILYPKSYILNSWSIAESPYILKDQKLRSYIYVKAIDKAGNEKVAMVEPRYPLKWYEYPEIWVIIILGLVIIYLVWKKLLIIRE